MTNGTSELTGCLAKVVRRRSDGSISNVAHVDEGRHEAAHVDPVRGHGRVDVLHGNGVSESRNPDVHSFGTRRAPRISVVHQFHVIHLPNIRRLIRAIPHIVFKNDERMCLRQKKLHGNPPL